MQPPQLAANQVWTFPDPSEGATVEGIAEDVCPVGPAGAGTAVGAIIEGIAEDACPAGPVGAGIAVGATVEGVV